MRFRDLYQYLVPAWLYNGQGGAVLYSLSALIDAQAQKARDSLECRFPRRASASANALTSADRGIFRGRAETDAHYAERLVRWRWPRGHRTRGSAFAWLEQVGEYWGGLPVESVDARGNRFSRTAAGVETAVHGTAWTWDDEPASSWSRFWGILDGRGVFTAHPLNWDDAYGGTWDPDSTYTIGQLGAAPGDAAAMRAMLRGRRAWKPAGTQAEWLIVVVDGAPSAIVPDATWERWSRVDEFGVRVETRSSSARYWRLRDAVNTYAGDAALWSGATRPGSGLYYEGDPASWPASAAGPDGTVYTGDPAVWPASALLPDDGDHL